MNLPVVIGLLKGERTSNRPNEAQSRVNKYEPCIQAEGTLLPVGPLDVLGQSRLGIVSSIQTSLMLGQKRDIAICNANTALMAFEDPEYLSVLNKMTLLNDGIGINIASKILNGRGFPENLNGTDLVPFLLEHMDRPLKIYLLGAREQQLQRTKIHIEHTYQHHEVVGARNGYFKTEDYEAVCAEISALKPDLLLVAMGNPLQERFIVENRHRLDVGVAIGVGALFDFLSGSVLRAPQIVQQAGLEWLFRFVQEPRRLFRRYVFGIPRFLYAVYKLKQQRHHAKSSSARLG